MGPAANKFTCEVTVKQTEAKSIPPYASKVWVTYSQGEVKSQALFPHGASTKFIVASAFCVKITPIPEIQF